MKFTKSTAAWAVTGALGLGVLAGGAFAIAGQSGDNNRPQVPVSISAQPGTQSAQSPVRPSASPTQPSTTAPRTQTAPSANSPTQRTTTRATTRTTTRKATVTKPTRKATTQRTYADSAPSGYSAPSADSSD